MIPTIQSVSSKGQLVIPKSVREALDIKPGSKVTLMVDKENRLLHIRPVDEDPIAAAIGSLKPKRGKKSIFKQMLQDKYDEIRRDE